MSEGDTRQRLRDLLAEAGAGASQDKAERRALAESIGPIIRELREQRGWSVHQLAKAADCNMSAIHHLEQGVRLPGRPLLRALLWVLSPEESE
jgi:ribosome-binding protein aMBF1 (putative translation factor)